MLAGGDLISAPVLGDLSETEAHNTCVSLCIHEDICLTRCKYADKTGIRNDHILP